MATTRTPPPGSSTDESPVDLLVREWRTERPDLDVGAMALFARANRFVTLGMRQIDAALAEHHLSIGEFDVLSALRRAGEPFTLRPSELADRLMVTRAGITSRVDRLEAAGLVDRRRDPTDRRSEPISLTTLGHRRIDEAIVAVVAVETQLFGGLSPRERTTLDRLLRRLAPTAVLE